MKVSSGMPYFLALFLILASCGGGESSDNSSDNDTGSVVENQVKPIGFDTRVGIIPSTDE